MLRRGGRDGKAGGGRRQRRARICSIRRTYAASRLALYALSVFAALGKAGAMPRACRVRGPQVVAGGGRQR